MLIQCYWQANMDFGFMGLFETSGQGPQSWRELDHFGDFCHSTVAAAHRISTIRGWSIRGTKDLSRSHDGTANAIGMQESAPRRHGSEVPSQVRSGQDLSFYS
jgi:hypothetical protein